MHKSRKKKEKFKNYFLFKEFHIYQEFKGFDAIPKIYYGGSIGNINVLAMELLGLSLEELFFKYKKFSLLTILMIADQVIEIIEFIHSKNYILCDMKPGNFVIGKGDNKNKIYVIDFGLYIKYMDPKTGLHIPYREGCRFAGVLNFASINGHLGIQLSRRDDIESFGYMLVYFLKGGLPWKNIRAPTFRDRALKIKDFKLNTTLDNICSGTPEEIKEIILKI